MARADAGKRHERNEHGQGSEETTDTQGREPSPASDVLNSSTPKKRRPGQHTTPFDKVTAQRKFLISLARYGNVTKAGKAARIDRVTAYAWRQADETFRRAWELALEDAAAVMEAEAWRRAVTGTKKPVYQGGDHVGDVREYSDTLLIFLLKAAAPDKYRERVQQQHSGEVTVRVTYVNDWRKHALADELLGSGAGDGGAGAGNGGGVAEGGHG